MTEAATEVTQTDEQIAAQEETDLSAGFNKVHGDKPSTEKKTEAKVEEKVAEVKATGNEQATATEVKSDAAIQADEKKAAPLIAGMTEAELKAALGKGAAWEAEVRKVFSKVGEMNRTVQELKSAIAAGGSKSTRKITAEQLKRVSEELPGLGEALAADLAGIFGDTEVATQKAEATAAAQGKPFDADAFFAEKIGPALETVKAQANESAQTELLEYMHPGYSATLKTPEFNTWLQSLPEARQKEVVESPRAVVAGRAITEFKEWHAKAQKAQERNKTRLEGAITPKGGGSPPGQPTQDDEADFASGFKKGSKKA